MAASGPASPARIAATLAQRFVHRPAETALTSPAAKRRRLAASSKASEATSTSSAVADVSSTDDGTPVDVASISTTTVSNGQLESHKRVVAVNTSMKRQRSPSPGSSSGVTGNTVRSLSTSVSTKPVKSASDTPSEDDLLKLERETLHSSWLSVLEKE